MYKFITKKIACYTKFYKTKQNGACPAKFCEAKRSGGFTLIETLVAISIFTFSVLALIAVLTNSLSHTNYAKKKLIATYLAQEGIEYVRNIRDTFVLYPDQSATSLGWNDFKVKVSVCNILATGGCYIDSKLLNFVSDAKPITEIEVLECPSGVCPALFYDAGSGEYNYVAGEATDYVRKIEVEQISDDEIKINSTVYWNQGSGTYHITFTENLFNWIR